MFKQTWSVPFQARFNESKTYIFFNFVRKIGRSGKITRLYKYIRIVNLCSVGFTTSVDIMVFKVFEKDWGIIKFRRK